MSAREQNIEQTGSEPSSDTSDAAPEQAEAEVVSLEAQLAAAKALLEANGYSVRLRTQVERALVAKADPLEVAAFFESSGLNRKELAEACGVGVSVIATVQNPNGDRWSQTLFEARKILVNAYVAAKAATIAAAEKNG